MRQFELYVDPHEQSVRQLNGRLAQLWTAIPGIVQSFNATEQTVVVQPAIRAVLFDINGKPTNVALPLLLDCPVQFPAGGGFALTFPVKAGDECLVVFSSRCIDGWWQAGGVQNQAVLRMHDLSDGFALLGFRSVPRALSNVSTSAVQLRSDDGATFVEVGQGEVTVDATAINLNGLVNVSQDVVIQGKSVLNHTHSDPQGGTVGPMQG